MELINPINDEIVMANVGEIEDLINEVDGE